MTGPAPLDLDSLREELTGLSQQPAAPKPHKPGEPIDLVALAEDLKDAHPAAAAPPPTLPSRPVAAAPPTRFPENQPRFVTGPGGVQLPWNEAAKDITAAAPYKGVEGEHQLHLDVMSPRTRALGYAVGLGRGILGIPGFVEKGLEAAGAGFTGPAYAREMAQRRLAGAPEETPPAVEFAKAPLSMLDVLGRAGRRDPEALGELGGFAVGGRLLKGAVPPGRAVMRGAAAAPEAAAAFQHLGLDPRTATEADVRAAWREAAQRTHPDAAPADRVARGGPADPIVAAQEFNRATEARETALRSLGRERPAQAFREPGVEETQFRARQAQRPAPEPPATGGPIVTPSPEQAARAEAEQRFAREDAAQAARKSRETMAPIPGEARGFEVKGPPPPEGPPRGPSVTEVLAGRGTAAAPPAPQAAPPEAIHPALAPEAKISFEAATDDPLKGPKERLAAQVAADGPSFAPIARMRQTGATDTEIASHLQSKGVRNAPEWVPLARNMFKIPQPGGEPTTEMPVPRETGAVEAGAPHDQAAVQEGLFGEKKLAGKEQAELLPETAGQPTAKLKAEKIAPEEVGRVKREGAEPVGERPMELEPERITGVAVRRPDGRVFTGTNHGEAMEAAYPGEGTTLGTESQEHFPEEGFVTSTGRFVGREEAGAIAAKAEQLTRGAEEGRAIERGAGRPFGLNAHDLEGTPEAAVPGAPRPSRGKEKVSKQPGTEKLLARHAELTAQIARDEQVMGAGTHISTFKDVGAHMGQPGQKFQKLSRSGKAYSAAGRLAQARQRLADLEKTMSPEELATARERAPAIASERAEEAAETGGRTHAEVEREAIQKEGERGLESRPEDYDELARKQHGPIPPALKATITDRLIEYGDTKEELAKLSPHDLAMRALEQEVLSVTEESKLLDVVWPDMGALVRPARRGAPIPQVTEPQRSVRDAFRKLFYPEKRGVEAQTAGRLLRRAIGEFRRDKAVYRQMLKDARHDVPSLKTSEGIEFYDRAENGVGQVKPELQTAVDIIRKIYAGLVRDIQALGTGKLEMPIENYMSHAWKDPAKAKQVYSQMRESQTRRPIAGSKAFLKERTIPTLVEGLKRNLEPITDNPIDLNIWKMDQMRRYLFAQRFMQDAKTEGIARFFRLGENLPDGWGRLEDPTFTVYGRSAEGELVTRGHWAMPTIARDLVSNYLSPGLRGNPLADAWLGAANSMVQFKLGVSGFHAFFSTFTGAISRTALAVGKIRTGKLPFGGPTKGGMVGGVLGGAIGAVAGGPGGAGLGLQLGSAAGRLLQKGLALKAAYLDPGAGTVLERQLADLMARAGGQHLMPDEYRTSTVKALKEAARQGNLPKAFAHTVGLALQTLAWPTMQFYVPLVKLGAFSDLAQAEVERLGPLASQAQVDEAVQRVWHSIDNRFGQVSYDTRFWNNTIKHILMGTIQAVGWDAGTIDELVGGLKDGLSRKPSLRLDFLIALPLTVALMGVMIQLALTGDGPSSVQDVFEPRNGKTDEFGNPERVVPATYMKDVAGFARHPVNTATNKLNPLIGFLGRLLSNRDFYGNKWRNEQDPVSEQLKQAAKYIADEWTPISVKNVGEERRRGVTGPRAALPMAGITPASREAVRTKDENLMIQMLRERTPARTPEEQEAALERRTARVEVTPDQRLVGMFRKLSPEQRQTVYAAAGEHNRGLYAPYVERRMRPYKQ